MQRLARGFSRRIVRHVRPPRTVLPSDHWDATQHSRRSQPCEWFVQTFLDVVMLVELLTSAVAFVLVLWSMWLFGTKTSYKDRHVVVIGGSTGIGLAIAKQLISRGAHITLVARRQPVLETAVNELMQHVQPGDRPPRVYVCSMDITDTDQVCMPSLIFLCSEARCFAVGTFAEPSTALCCAAQIRIQQDNCQYGSSGCACVLSWLRNPRYAPLEQPRFGCPWTRASLPLSND